LGWVIRFVLKICSNNDNTMIIIIFVEAKN
jgi:hypothetical protein